MTLSELGASLRGQSKRVAFVAVALTSLAVSVGLATAVFAVVRTLFLSVLPYDGAERLVMIWTTEARVSKKEAEDEISLSPGAFSDLRDSARSFDGLAAFLSEFVNVTGVDEPSRAHVLAVAGDLFSLTGTTAVAGRTLGPYDERPESERVVVISHGFWMRQFGGEPSVIGRKLKISGREHEVVGVLPADFRFFEGLAARDPRFSKPVDVWAPLALGDLARERRMHALLVVARLKPGVSLRAAQEEVHAYSEYAAEHYGETDEGFRMRVVSLREQFFGHLRAVLVTLSVATGLVLLIACANLGTLLVARWQRGRCETAVRLALGASRPRLILESLLENGVLSLTGGLLALFVAFAGLRLLTALGPVQVLRAYPPRMDLWVLMAAIGLSIVIGFLFGGVPALWASRTSAAESLRAGSLHVTSWSRLVFFLLVVAQIALTTTLLIGMGLSTRSLLGLLRADLGANLERVATLEVSLPRSQYGDPSRRAEFYRELLERIGRLPGVASVGLNEALPLSGRDLSNQFAIEGRPPLERGQIQSASLGAVNPDYFKTLGIPLLRGRLFRDSDAAGAPLVAIVDEWMTERYFGGEEPLGRRIRAGGSVWMTIVGVVGSVRLDAFEKKKLPYVYRPYLQSSHLFSSLAIKTRVEDARALAPAVREVVRGLDEGIPISEVSTLEEAYRRAITLPRFGLLLVSVLAAAALFLALLGVYGVMDVLARQREREIGIRLALGAQPRRVLALVVGQALSFSLLGSAVGIGIAVGVRRILASLVYGIGTLDPLVFGASSATVLVAAIAAAYLPARRLAGVNPRDILQSA